MISLLFIIQACKRTEPDCGDLSDVITNYNIADSNKAKIPYTGTDTLVFISDAGDTATLIGQGKNTHYESVRSNISGGDCPRSSVTKYEYVDYEYNGKNLLIPYCKFSIFKFDQYGNPSTTTIKFIITNNVISISNFEYINSIKVPQDSILLNNKFIDGVYMEYNSNKTLFNFKNGILKFEYDDKKWTLNSKI